MPASTSDSSATCSVPPLVKFCCGDVVVVDLLLFPHAAATIMATDASATSESIRLLNTSSLLRPDGHQVIRTMPSREIAPDPPPPLGESYMKDGPNRTSSANARSPHA